MDVEELESHFGGFQGMVQAQSWEIAFMSTPLKKITLPQTREFYHTRVKVNEEYYNTKVDRQTFHLRSDNIAQLLGVPNDRDKT